MKRLVLTTVCLVTFAFESLPAAAGELKVGEVAPNFTVQASDGHTYTLADFRGKQAVVLAWFPKAYTRGRPVRILGPSGYAAAASR